MFQKLVVIAFFAASTSADTCVKQVQFTDVAGLLPFDASIVDSTQACVVLCVQRKSCRSVVVKALASGQLCALNSRAAMDSELQFQGDGAAVNYIQLLDSCPNSNQISSLKDVANGQNAVRQQEPNVNPAFTRLWQQGIAQQVAPCNNPPCVFDDGVERRGINPPLPMSAIMYPAGGGQYPTTAWSQWSSWSQCSVTCGMGICIRTRTCSSGYCQGASTETQACQTQTCPPPCESWSAWSVCDAYCGQGTQKRTRACGYKTETITQTCLAQQCANWGDWASWSQCSSTCGQGQCFRTRTCSPRPGMCDGNDKEYQSCSIGPCPQFGQWNNWSACSTTCGPSQQYRTRTCSHGNMCQGQSVEEKSCDTGPCAQWNAWQPWSSCSATCGTGTYQRGRTCQYGTNCQQIYGNNAQEYQECYNGPCPTAPPPPSYGSWSSYGPCSATCGSGYQTRTRPCQNQYENFGCDGPAQEAMPCQIIPCGGYAPYADFLRNRNG